MYSAFLITLKNKLFGKVSEIRQRSFKELFTNPTSETVPSLDVLEVTKFARNAVWFWSTK